MKAASFSTRPAFQKHFYKKILFMGDHVGIFVDLL